MNFQLLLKLLKVLKGLKDADIPTHPKGLIFPPVSQTVTALKTRKRLQTTQKCRLPLVAATNPGRMFYENKPNG